MDNQNPITPTQNGPADINGSTPPSELPLAPGAENNDKAAGVPYNNGMSDSYSAPSIDQATTSSLTPPASPPAADTELPPATSPDDLQPPKLGSQAPQEAERPAATAPSNSITKDPKIKPTPEQPSSPPPVAPRVPSGFTPPGATAPMASAPPIAPKVPKQSIIRRSSNINFPKIILGALAFLLIAAGVFFFFFYRVTLNINIPNTPDQIILDGKPIKAGTTKIMPGAHSLLIEKKGFISYRIEKSFSIGEKLNIAFALKPQSEPQLVVSGAKMAVASFDQKFINFVAQDNTLGAVPTQLTDSKYVPVQLSNSSFPNIRQALFSKTNTFALVLDSEALKLVDFTKTNLLDQVVTKLPPDPSRISSITWNNNSSDFVADANSKIAYDLKTDSLWNIYLANRTHTQSEIFTDVDGTVFSNLNLDLGNSKNQILISGGELGIFDISGRTYQQISKDKNIHFASWGPNGTYALAVSQANDAYVLKNGQLESLNLKTTAGQVTFLSEKEALIIAQGCAVKINFDTNKLTSYAEIKGLSEAKSVASVGGNLFFTTSQGLEVAVLTENVYE